MNNKHICFARKKKNPYCRCSNKNKIEEGHIFCKTHNNQKQVFRIDEPYLNTENHNTITYFLLSSKDSKDICLSNYKKKDLVKILNYFNIKLLGSKEKILIVLNKHVNSIKKYLIHYKKIIIIQRTYRNYKTRKMVKLQGPIIYNKNLSINKEDFLSFDKIIDIPDNLIFSYIDKDKYIYAFHIKSIYELLKETDLNPYNRIKIPIFIKEKVKIHYKKSFEIILKEDKKELIEFKGKTKNLKLKTRQDIIEIFQLMDELDQYTNPEWFIDLDKNKLILFYKELEDIWNYRLNLTKEMKIEIIPPDGNLFLFTPKYVSKLNDLYLIRKICIDVMKKLITKSHNRSNKVNGCMYILLALVMVNKNAAQSLPIYYNMITENSNSSSSYLIPV